MLCTTANLLLIYQAWNESVDSARQKYCNLNYYTNLELYLLYSQLDAELSSDVCHLLRFANESILFPNFDGWKTMVKTTKSRGLSTKALDPSLNQLLGEATFTKVITSYATLLSLGQYALPHDATHLLKVCAIVI